MQSRDRNVDNMRFVPGPGYRSIVRRGRRACTHTHTHTHGITMTLSSVWTACATVAVVGVYVLPTCALATRPRPFTPTSTERVQPSHVHSRTCASDLDCQLNGACVQGACVCDKGWRGTDCGTLHLDTTPTVAYGWTNTSNISAWGGGPPVYDTTTGKYVHDRTGTIDHAETCRGQY